MTEPGSCWPPPPPGAASCCARSASCTRSARWTSTSRCATAKAPSAYVLRLAEAKAAALWQRLEPGERRPVLAADTTVALEGEIFGKPGSLAEARAMLGRAVRTHARGCTPRSRCCTPAVPARG